jgi:hypothetical protein
MVPEPYWLVSVLSSDPDTRTMLKSYTINDDSGQLWLKLTSWFHDKYKIAYTERAGGHQVSAIAHF